MRKSMMIGVFGIVALGCGLLRQLAAQSSSTQQMTFPKACYFFVPQKGDATEKRQQAREPDDETAYDASFAEVYRLWCTDAHSAPGARTAAVDGMVKRWKAVWEKEENAAFDETGAIDLLYLLGLTHQLPAQMVNDPEFTKEWVERCAESCFTIWSVPENRLQEHTLAMELWLRNDVLDNLKKEPASEPVIKMLEEAQYRLVD